MSLTVLDFFVNFFVLLQTSTTRLVYKKVVFVLLKNKGPFSLLMENKPRYSSRKKANALAIQSAMRESW